MSSDSATPADGIFLAGIGDDAVLLLHGLTGAPAEMYPLGKQLRRAGATVYAPLIAGHGGSNALLLSTSWPDWLASAERAFDQLARRHRRVHVGGICLGAMLAVALAVRRDVHRMAVYGPTFRYDGWSMPRIAGYRRLILLLAGLPLVRNIAMDEQAPFGLKDEKVRAFVVAAQQRANGGVVDGFPLGAIRQLYQLADHVDHIAPMVRTPTLICHAEEDDISSIANAHRLRAALGCETHLEILRDSYHLVHLDRENGHVAATTAAFFGLSRSAGLRTANAGLATSNKAIA
ncbi:alpha/beta hydrolase [Rhizorhabdus argentea]|uniref:alpha/beta hydrolase n=1 Tax=Rhizorhabdus argentea TaxID=1387174 RepID=UPI0030EBD483